MQSLRPVVKAFCDAAETHASPVLRGSPLTDDERAIIRMYMDTLEKTVLGVSSEEKTPVDQ
jgi:hypothetical protein